MAIPVDRNVVQKEAEKKLKYKRLCIEIQRNVEPEMYDYTSDNWSHWNSNEKLKEKYGSCTRKSFDRFATKTAILGTSHIVRKVLQSDARNLSVGDHCWFKRSTGKNRFVTRATNMIIIIIIIIII